MARFRLSGHSLRIETGRHEGLPLSERSFQGCKRESGEDWWQQKTTKNICCFVKEYRRHKVALCWPAHVKFDRFDAV
jgi:hypothetical protein